MNLRIFAVAVISFILGAALFPTVMPASSDAKEATVSSRDDRAVDREAIRAHIEKIFKAYVERDCATIRATHAQNWIGFTNGATSILRGLDAYMKNSPRFCQENIDASWGLSGYKLTEIDYQFYGDVALVPYVADVTYGRPNPVPAKLRSLDIYAKVNGEWNQVGSNIGFHPDTVQQQFEQAQRFRQLGAEEKQKLLAAREAVWRAYFSNDRAQLEKYLPQETIAINPGGEDWANQADVLRGAAGFVQSGGKLVSLEFPRTEMQVYGNVAILYSEYRDELEVQGKRVSQAGRATEIFVNHDGTFVNVGWHLDSGK